MEALQGGAEDSLKGYQKNFSFGGDRFINYLDYDDGFTLLCVYQNVHFNYVHLIPPLSGLKNDNLRKYTWGNSCILMKWNPDNPQN